MNMPGFSSESSVYRSSGRYYTRGVPVQNGGTIYPAQRSCQDRCYRCCVTACQHDGIARSFCQRLCHRDCEAYGPCWPSSCSREPPPACGTCGPCNIREVYPPGSRSPLFVDYSRKCTDSACREYRKVCLVCGQCIGGSRACYPGIEEGQEQYRQEPC